MENTHVHRPGCGCAGYELSHLDDNLWDVIDHANIQCLNENVRDSCKGVFRQEEDRLNFNQLLESPVDDPEIILVIPFTQQVKVRVVQMISVSEANRPVEANLFKNEENFDFSISEEEPTEHFELNTWTPDNQIEVGTQIKRFAATSKLLVHIRGDQQIRLNYFAVKGIRTKVKRQIVRATYEKAGMVSDHSSEIKNLMKNNNTSLL